MGSLTLRARLLLLVLFALLPALGLIIHSAQEHQQRTVSAAQEEALRLAGLMADDHESLVDGARQFLVGLAQLPAVHKHDAVECSTFFASALKRFPFYTTIGAGKPNGDIFCSALPLSGRVNVIDREYFQRVLRTRDFVVGGYLVGRATGKPALTLAYPAIDERRAVNAVVLVGLDLAWLGREGIRAYLPPGATFTVIDGQGTVLARHPDSETWLGKSAGETAVVRAVLAQHRGTVEADGLDGVRRLHGFVPLLRRQGSAPNETYVWVGIPKDGIVAEGKRALARDLTLLGLATLGVLVMAWIGGDLFVLRRVAALVTVAKRLATGTLSARTQLAHGRDELGQLARAFDEMAAALEARQSDLLATTGALREANQRLSTIVETSPLAIWTLDHEGRVTTWNPAAERIFGWRQDEVLGRPHPIIPEDAQDEFRAILGRLLQGETLLGLELRRRKRSGVLVDIAVSAAPLLDPFGIVLGGIAIAADITDHKRAEAELLRVNRALRVLSACNIELVRAGTEPDLLRVICETIVSVGGYRFAWVGFAERDEARTLRPVAHAGHEEGYLELLNVTWGDAQGGGGAVAAALRSGQPAVVKDILTDPRFASRRSEAIRRGYASVIALPLVHAERPLGALVIYSSERDAFDAEEVGLLTELANDLAYGIVALRTRAERTRAEEELQRQRETLYQSEKLAAMGQLLAGVAHELNNPLSVVLGHALMLRRSTDDGPLAERAEKITQAAQRCARIVRNFLALARQQPPERQETRLNQVAEEAAELLAYPLKVDNVEVALHLAPDLPPIWADPHQLHQVVVNLISNAQQAMRKTGPPRRITLSTGFDSSRSRAFLRVADTGPGIPQEIQNRIFEPFFTTKPPGQGTGLGLALCHGIVEEHGGTIRVASEPGKGAMFTVELPMGAPPVAARGPRAGEAEAVTGKSILVADDEAEVADILAEMLSADGHSVDTAANGNAALEKLAQRSYDLIVSDIRMPELDGPGLYREVAQRHPDLLRRFIFVTGDSLSHETSEFLEQTGVVTFDKPFESEKLRTAVRRALQES